jgi:hypothetical protein
MKRTHPAFWGAGLAGVFVGTAMTLIGLTSASELAQMAGGYGLMMAGSALYLLAGLGLRQALARRSQAPRTVTQTVSIGSRAASTPNS